MSKAASGAIGALPEKPRAPAGQVRNSSGADLRTLSGSDLRETLPCLAALRTSVFRKWPYLYEGDEDYERAYLGRFAEAPGAVIVGAFDAASGAMVGAATACPLTEADPAFARPFERCAHPPADWFYFGESVLDPAWRGRGIGVAFFEHRERAAREKGFARATFCAVERDPSDPRRPRGHKGLDGFWSKRGYAPLDLRTTYRWRDVGEDAESAKTMRFWGRAFD